MLSIAITSNWCFNYIERLQTQERDHNKSFQLFSDSYSHYKGVTEVISGGSCAPKSAKAIVFCHATQTDHPIRDLNIIERLQARDRDHYDPFQSFSDSDSYHQGVTGVISGG